MATLAELRAKVQKAQTRPTNFDSSSIFSFSKLNAGDQIRIRFVPDGEPNDFFWRPLCTRRLQFDSLRLTNGSIVQNRTYVSIPAFNLKKGEANISNLSDDYIYYSNDDVIQQKIKGFWNNTEEGKALYSKFGRTERYIFQGFVRADGYETKLYRFVINKELFNIIYSFMTDDEISDMPSDLIHGRDFILKVSEKQASIGGKTQMVKDYSTSKWSSKETPLTEEESAWLAENGYFTLKNFTSQRPTADQEDVMIELFNASYNGEPYDVARWGKIFRPDNVYFDEAGNIKDMKSSATVNATAHEIPTESYTPAVSTPAPAATAATTFTNEMLAAQLLQLAQAQAAQPAQPAAAPAPTAPQLIKENTVEVSGDTPSAVIADIMSKFKIPQA